MGGKAKTEAQGCLIPRARHFLGPWRLDSVQTKGWEILSVGTRGP